MGGRVSYLAACALPDKIRRRCRSTAAASRSIARRRCGRPVLAFFGEDDPFIPLDQVRGARGRGARARASARDRRLSEGAARLLLQRARLVSARRRRGRVGAPEGVLRHAPEGLMRVRILLVGQAAFAEQVLAGPRGGRARGRRRRLPARPRRQARSGQGGGASAAASRCTSSRPSRPAEAREAFAARATPTSPCSPTSRRSFPSRSSSCRAGTAICFHPSLLPRYRGGSAIPWQLIRGETRSGRHGLLARRGHRHRTDPAAARGAGRTRRHRRHALLQDALPARRADRARQRAAHRRGPRAARAAGRAAGDVRSAARRRACRDRLDAAAARRSTT